MDFSPNKAFTNSFASYNRQLGAKLYDELANGLQQGNYYAITGPYGIGKGTVVDEVGILLERKNIEILTLHIDRQIVSESKGFANEFYDLWNTNKQLLPESFEARNYLYNQSIHESKRPRLSDYLLKVMTGHIDAVTTKRVVLLVRNITGLTLSTAHELLTALQGIHSDLQYRERFSAMITGRAEFLGMCQGDNSPFRFAKRRLIVGSDMEKTKHDLQAFVGTGMIEDTACDYIYEQTWGTRVLYTPLADLLKGDFLEFRNKKTGAVANMKAWALEEVQNVLAHQAPFTQEKMFSIFRSAPCLARLINNLISSPKAFEQAIGFIEQPDIPLQNEPSIHGDRHKDISFLEAHGAVIKDCNNTAHASPLMKWFMEVLLQNNRYIGDIFCIHGKWSEARERYEQAGSTDQYRPVAGEARTRLQTVLTHWSAALPDRVNEGVDSLIQFFFLATEHLLCLERGALWVVDNDNDKIIVHAGYGSNWTSLSRDQIASDFHIKRSDNCLAMQAKWPLKTDGDDQAAALWLILERTDPEKQIDTSRAKNFQKHIERFAEQLGTALRKQSDREMAQLNNTLSRAQAAFAREVSKTTFSLEQALAAVCHEIRKDFCSLVTICLLSARKASVASFYTNLDDPESANLAELLEKEINKLQGTPGYLECQTSSNCLNLAHHEQTNGLPNVLKECFVTPLIVDREITGLLLGRKTDKKLASTDELAAFDRFSQQIAAYLLQLHRMEILTDTLNSLDDLIVINNQEGQAIFQNRAASKLTKKGEGWAKNPFTPGRSLFPHHEREVVKKRLDQIIQRKQHQLYFPEYNKGDIKAVDWRVVLLNKQAALYSVERFHDVSKLVTLLELARELGGKVAADDKAKVILNYLAKNGYDQAGFWFNQDQATPPQWKQLAGVAPDDFEPDSDNPAFSRNLNKKIEMRIVENDPGVHQAQQAHDQLDLPAINLPAFKGKAVSARLVMPLREQKGVCFAKIVIFKYVKQLSQSPSDWRYLQMISQIASQSIFSALQEQKARAEKALQEQRTREEKELLGRMLAHRMSPNLARCRSLIRELFQDKCSVTPDTRASDLRFLEHQTVKCQILIQHLLGQGKEQFEIKSVDIGNLFADVRIYLTDEIQGLEGDYSLKRIGWDCHLVVEEPFVGLSLIGERDLLWIALDNLGVNAIEHLQRQEQPGGIITLSAEQVAEGISLTVTSTLVAIDDEEFSYMRRVFASSGHYQELSALQAPKKQERAKGTNQGLGLKLVSWVINHVHGGSVTIEKIDQRQEIKIQCIIPSKCTSEISGGKIG